MDHQHEHRQLYDRLDRPGSLAKAESIYPETSVRGNDHPASDPVSSRANRWRRSVHADTCAAEYAATPLENQPFINKMKIFQFRAMNSDIVLLAEGYSQTRIDAGFQAIKAYIESSERKFTRFSEESELSRMNRSTGKWFHASAEMFTIMREAQVYYRKAGGLFDPSILSNLLRIGYTCSMDELRRFGADPEPAGRLMSKPPAFGSIQFDESSHGIFLPADLHVDLGGLAKGWVAGQAAQILSEYSSACAVSAGGDMVLTGHPDGRDFWEVALEDPRDANLDLTILQVGEGAVATSSTIRRVWQQGGSKRHHLIDPHTGEPALPKWISVTVIAPNISAAEVFAKAFLLAGPSQTSQMLTENPELTCLAVDSSGIIWDLSTNREYQCQPVI